MGELGPESVDKTVAAPYLRAAASRALRQITPQPLTGASYTHAMTSFGEMYLGDRLSANDHSHNLTTPRVRSAGSTLDEDNERCAMLAAFGFESLGVVVGDMYFI